MRGRTLKNLSLPNAQLLNINRILTTNPNGNIGNIGNIGSIGSIGVIKNINGYDNSDIGTINNIFNNNVSRKYNIVKYLGEGIQGSLYLANDNNATNNSNNNNNSNKRYICKKIILNNSQSDQSGQSGQSGQADINNQTKQIEFELNILKYLSSNKTTKEHVNTCLEHKIVNNEVFTVFPVFNGYSLQHLIKYLSQLKHGEYYKIIFHLIKTILHGMAKIHQTNIAHQNINNNSILISTYEQPGEIKVKFTDFGLGCGNRMNFTGPQISKDDVFYKFNNCNTNNYTPIEITDNIIDELGDSDYLAISQKYDLLCLGMIFIKLLLFFEKLDINLKKGYNQDFIANIKNRIEGKYIGKNNMTSGNVNGNNNNDDTKYNSLFPFLNIDDKTKKIIVEYLKIINDYIFCKTINRKNCQYILDKLIIYEKYRDDVF
uniref:Protein kinase domain-containing protein n=1 Tax=viral metagenome TaxID=1070528 RepID=A0A6C0EYU2_9ZZZZ